MLLCRIVSSACLVTLGACVDKPKPVCPDLMDFWEGTVRRVLMTETRDGLVLFAMGYKGIHWHRVNQDGTLGPATGEVLWIEGETPISTTSQEGKLAVLETAGGFRLITNGHSLYFNSQDRASTPVELVLRSPAVPETAFFGVQIVWMVDTVPYVGWAAGEGTDSGGTCWAGLGILNEQDQVEAVGDPLYVGTSTEPWDIPSCALNGGWDVGLQRFWIDHPEGAHVLEVDRDGTVLQMHDRGQSAMPSLNDWSSLPSGRWAALHGKYWCLFSPLDRVNIDCRDSSDYSFTPDEQQLAADGRLWIAYRAPGGVVLRWFDDATSMLSDGVFTAVTVGECSMMLESPSSAALSTSGARPG